MLTSRPREQQNSRSHFAFTLIESLVVMAIIGTLAALLMVTSRSVKVKQQLKLTQAELAQMQAAIESYKAAIGFYPPDNPTDPAMNPLYYELLGTTNDPVNGVYQTLDGSATINAASLPATLGVAGFVNCARTGGREDAPSAKSRLRDLKPRQIGAVTINGVTVKLLVGSVGWPADVPPPPPQTQPGLNPWRYVSSHPKNNAGSYDLWIDVRVGGKTYRLSNWSRVPEIL